MRTKRFWANRFTEFINVLQCEVTENEEFARVNNREYQWLLEQVLLSVNEPGYRLKKTAMLIYINHELNLIDPIEVYPCVRDEYLSYAKKIVDKLLVDEDPGAFSNSIKAEINDMWDAFAIRLPKRNEAMMNCLRVVKQFNADLTDEKQKWGDCFSEHNFWVKQLYLYIDILHEERKNYHYRAVLFQEEIDRLVAEKETNFKKYENNLDDYIFYLYINRSLNLLDPTGRIYPVLTYPFGDIAWEIVKTYKSAPDENEFIKVFEETVVALYRKLGCDAANKKARITERVSRVYKKLQSLK